MDNDPAAGSSIWPLIATLLLADQNVPVAFIPTAKGGTSINSWQPNSLNRGDTWTLYGSMYRRINAVGGVKAVLFWQGETDAIDGMSQAVYKSKLVALANSIYSDFGIKTVVAQIGDESDLSGNNLDNIRLAQQSAWNDNGNVLAGPSIYDVAIADYVHFQSNTELQLVANRFWAAIQKEFYNGPDGRGPIISSAQYNSTKTNIALTFTDDTLPLLPANGFSGITLKDNGVVATISTIAKTATNKLLITLGSAASGTITVSLGQGRTGTGATVPTDSSTYNLPAEIFVDYPTTQMDETAPSVTLSNPSSPKTASSTIVLSATSTDTVAVAGVTFYRGSTAIGSEVTSTSSQDTYSTSWDTTSVSDGLYTVTAVARDTSGNYATSTGVVVTVHNSPPVSAPVQSITTSYSSSGGSASSQVHNLLAMGNYTLAKQIAKQYGIILPMQNNPDQTIPANTNTPTSNSGQSFTRTLKIGMTNNDVKQLQAFLNAQGFAVNKSGAGSPGHETNYFGTATKAALMKFQLDHKTETLDLQRLKSPTGFFGIDTMKAVNKLLK